MAKKTTGASPLAGFDGVLGALSPQQQGSSAANLDDMSVNIKDDDSVIDLSLAKKAEEVDHSGQDDIDDDDINARLDFGSDADDDDDDDHQDEIPTTNNDDNDDEDVHTNEDGDESGQVSLFFDAFSESLGWDSDTENKPKTIEELIDYIGTIVEENSTADYANDQVKELDDYVRNGGKLEDYLAASSKVSSFDSLDYEDEDDQKTIVREFLKRNGFNDKQISKKIEKYEDAGLLEDEAEEALEFLKADAHKEKAAKLKEQEQARVQAEEQQAKFYNDVVSEIETLKDIRGIAVPQKDRKELMDYIFKVGSDGQTKYQKDYAANFKRNLLESAYFTMKGDALLSSAKKGGETSAVQRLKQSMKTNKLGSSKHSMDNGQATPVWAAASNLFGGSK